MQLPLSRIVRALLHPALLATLGLAALSLNFVTSNLFKRQVPSHDTYAHFLPNMLYALDRLREGGRGILWNSFQSCGEPFFANALTALLYPPHLLFTVLAPHTALLAVLFLNMMIGGMGTYALCRSLGAGPIPAAAGAVVFLLGRNTTSMASWSPNNAGAYCWLPVALVCTERLLRAPTARNTLALGGVLTLALLPGYPQMTAFIYLMIGLRVIWEALALRVREPQRTLPAFAIAGLLPLLFGSVQIWPFIEIWRHSIRSGPISEGGALRSITLDGLWLATRGNYPLLAALALAPVTFLRSDTRRHALFFFTAAVLFVCLAFGPGTPVYDLYANLPGATLFRNPARFMWMMDVCVAAITSLGLEQISESSAGLLAGDSQAQRIARSALHGLTAAVLPAAVVLIATSGQRNTQMLLRSPAPLFRYETAFQDLRWRMTPADRVYLLHPHPIESRFGFIHRSASIFGVRSLFNYEHLTNRRYAEFFVTMRTGHPLRRLSDFLLGHYLVGWMPKGFRWNMLSLVGGRYLLIDPDVRGGFQTGASEPLQTEGYGDLRLYENPSALPRAFFVSGVRVLPDPRLLLHELSQAAVRVNRVALVEESPPSGFLGSTSKARGARVDFIIDNPEHLELRIRAPQRGFLFLSDTYYPGWTAEVNGRPTPIQRANYAFRLVEVPAGESTVVFRFRPLTVRIGAWFSVSSVIGAAVVLVWGHRRGRR